VSPGSRLSAEGFHRATASTETLSPAASP
jgi:hypothetical protein